ncbi:MAG: lysine transporter LysE [Thermoprotei archaeon]|nr:MAG: lysine transporter LysE [Thermoprotei archaeon]RLF16146.1 MAG: lysine transporter LysE [Thermoprotei archaeon]
MSLGFLLKISLISCSGALAPGPLTAATAALGVKRGWRGGFWVGMGHMLVEAPLVLLVGLGLVVALTSRMAVVGLSLAGGFFMLGFAALTFRDAFKFKGLEGGGEGGRFSSPILVGVGLTALNPFFIIWWGTVGAPLILEGLGYWGLPGLIPLYAAHVWLDYAWLSLVAHLTSLGGSRAKIYRAMLIGFSIFLVVFGVDFVYYALTETHLLPL